MPTRFAKEPRYGLSMCVPIDVELPCWVGGAPRVSWGEYCQITGQSGFWAFCCWLKGDYDHDRYSRITDTWRHTKKGDCYSFEGVQVHFCDHEYALGLLPDGSPDKIPDEFYRRLEARK